MGEGHENGSGRCRSGFLLLAMAMTGMFHLSPSGCGGSGDADLDSGTRTEGTEGTDQPGRIGESIVPEAEGVSGSIVTPPGMAPIRLGYFRADLRMVAPLLVKEGRLPRELLEEFLRQTDGSGRTFPFTTNGWPQTEEWRAIPVEEVGRDEVLSHCSISLPGRSSVFNESVGFAGASASFRICDFGGGWGYAETSFGVIPITCNGYTSWWEGEWCGEAEWRVPGNPESEEFFNHMVQTHKQLEGEWIERVCGEGGGYGTCAIYGGLKSGWKDMRGGNGLDPRECCPGNQFQGCGGEPISCECPTPAPPRRGLGEESALVPKRALSCEDPNPCQANQNVCENRVACLQNNWKTNPPPCLGPKMAECFKNASSSGMVCRSNGKDAKCRSSGFGGYVPPGGEASVICADNKGNPPERSLEITILHELVHQCDPTPPGFTPLAGLPAEQRASDCEAACFSECSGTPDLNVCGNPDPPIVPVTPSQCEL